MFARRLPSMVFAAAFVAAVACAPALVAAAEAPGLHVFIGTYTEGGSSQGVYHARFDPATGALTKPEAKAQVPNPSFVTVHPNHKFLYAVSEVLNYGGQPAGGVYAFAIDPSNGNLTALNQQSAGGTVTCYCVVDHSGRDLLIANYGSGSVACLPINPDGTLKPASAFVQHEGHGPNASRQEGPHAHSLNVDPQNHFAIAADLGIDKLLVYRFDAERGALEPNDPPSTSVAPGSGPRHFAFHPNGQFAYAIDELALTVTAFRYAPQHGVLYGIQTIRTVPDDVNGPQFSTADVHVHPSGKFLYGSNRGHDSIAMYAIEPESGMLTSLGQQSTLGKTPRNFGIDPSGRFLLAANQDSDSIVVFQIDQETGKLKPTGTQVACPKPVCIQFMP